MPYGECHFRRPTAPSRKDRGLDGLVLCRYFVERIGGEFRIGRGDHNNGAFTVLFS